MRTDFGSTLFYVPLTSEEGLENQRIAIQKHARIKCNESAKKEI